MELSFMSHFWRLEFKCLIDINRAGAPYGKNITNYKPIGSVKCKLTLNRSTFIQLYSRTVWKHTAVYKFTSIRYVNMEDHTIQ